MAKKLGKFLLFSAAIGSTAAAAYYYLKKRTTETAPETEGSPEEEHVRPLEKAVSRSYVPLTPDATGDAPESSEAAAEAAGETSDADFTPLSESAEDAAGTEEKASDETEEFFDEEDAAEDASAE